MALTAEIRDALESIAVRFTLAEEDLTVSEMRAYEWVLQAVSCTPTVKGFIHNTPQSGTGQKTNFG